MRYPTDLLKTLLHDAITEASDHLRDAMNYDVPRLIETPGQDWGQQLHAMQARLARNLGEVAEDLVRHLEDYLR